ncbi:hypothetical protein NECID01_0800 [Nematocida sp. AWRm77]|nr:hypothetical protein NECID01_0800 [Nematocida sp. AWRm77]
MSHTRSVTKQKMVFRLRGSPGRKRVTFTEDTVDNEHLCRKKSKACCIFHKKNECENQSPAE